jgi:hypothetical protein
MILKMNFEIITNIRTYTFQLQKNEGNDICKIYKIYQT